MAKVVIPQRITHALGRVPVNTGSGLLFGRPFSISPQPMSLRRLSKMASFVKIWTTILHNEKFLALSLHERGAYSQLIYMAKEQADDGLIRVRSRTELGSRWGCDGKTCGKILGKLQEISLVDIVENDRGVLTLKLPNYLKWQRLTPDQVVKKQRKSRGKVKEISPTPDQTRPKQSKADQTKAEHLLSETSSDHKKAVEYWCSKYLDRFQVKYDFRAGKDGMAVKQLLATFKLEGFCGLVDQIFLSEDPFYRTGGGLTLTVLKANANKLAQEIARQDSPLDRFSDKSRETFMAGVRVLKKLEEEDERKKA